MKKRADRLYLLDIVRGLASLSVVIWHYQHFFFVAPSTLPLDFVRASQPMYGTFSLLYNEGSRAVYLFFVLSGFIFFVQYAEEIRSGRVSGREFFILRFSRLYPLHALTISIVGIGQAISHSIDGHFIVYHCNDLKRSILSILFLTDWLPTKYVCNTLNAPTWSLSVEAFLYTVFFLFARNNTRATQNSDSYDTGRCSSRDYRLRARRLSPTRRTDRLLLCRRHGRPNLETIRGWLKEREAVASDINSRFRNALPSALWKMDHPRSCWISVFILAQF